MMHGMMQGMFWGGHAGSGTPRGLVVPSCKAVQVG